MPSTPTLDKHIAFLNSEKILAGLSLNSNLYSKSEGDDNDHNLPANIDQLSNSTQEDKLSTQKQVALAKATSL